jgi:hypothetical protein
MLLPEGLWGDDGDWVPLPPPEDDEVEAVLHRLLRATFAALESRWPESLRERREDSPEEHGRGLVGLLLRVDAKSGQTDRRTLVGECIRTISRSRGRADY